MVFPDLFFNWLSPLFCFLFSYIKEQEHRSRHQRRYALHCQNLSILPHDHHHCRNQVIKHQGCKHFPDSTPTAFSHLVSSFSLLFTHCANRNVLFLICTFSFPLLLHFFCKNSIIFLRYQGPKVRSSMQACLQENF